MYKHISNTKMDVLAPVVYELIRHACINGLPAPSYSSILSHCIINGKQLSSNVIPYILKRLESDGLIERFGTFRDRRYRLPTGEETTAHLSIPIEKIVKGPTLEDRAKMWDVPVRLTHPSDRHLKFDRRFMPPPGSLAGIQYTVI